MKFDELEYTRNLSYLVLAMSKHEKINGPVLSDLLVELRDKTSYVSAELATVERVPGNRFMRLADIAVLARKAQRAAMRSLNRSAN
jgi:hypothetical protein